MCDENIVGRRPDDLRSRAKAKHVWSSGVADGGTLDGIGCSKLVRLNDDTHESQNRIDSRRDKPRLFPVRGDKPAKKKRSRVRRGNGAKLAAKTVFFCEAGCQVRLAMFAIEEAHRDNFADPNLLMAASPNLRRSSPRAREAKV